MKMMSEKQKDLIVKLSHEKYLEKGLLFEFEAITGHDLTAHNFENLTCHEASMLIQFLFEAPTNEEYQRKQAKFEEGKNKYDKLVEWAKSQGLKVRNKMKKTTILSAIQKAGLEVPAELK